MEARFAVALSLLLACVILAAAHPRLRSLDVGAFHEFPADEWSMATEALKYERHLIALNNGLYTYAGNPTESRTVKLEVYFPPVVLPTPMEMPGWKAEMYPCESSGKLQCDGWNVVSYTAHSWDYSFNNSYYYNFPIGIRLKDDCKCNVPLVCEIVDVESTVPGVEASDEPTYFIWIPSIQYTSRSSMTPDYAVFWTHNWDVWKGERDNVRADMLLDFTDHPMYIWKNGSEPADDYMYSNGRRAVKGKVTDWANCNYMEFNGKRIAVPELDLQAISSSSGKDTAIEVGAASTSDVNTNDNMLSVVALGMAIAALIIGVGAVAYAHMMVMNARKQMQPSATMDGASKPVKMGA